MDLQKLINTMCEIIGEKNHIKVTAQIHNRGDFLHYEGVVKYDGQNKNKESGRLYKGIHSRAS